jgi:hypothetical protein
MSTPRTTAVHDLVVMAAQLAELAVRLAAESTPDDELLPLEAAGTMVHVTPRAIRDAGRRGEIEIVHVGRSPRVRRSALTAWARVAPTTATVATLSPREAARAAVAARAARVGAGR